MTELYLPTTIYREIIERLLPVAGAGNADQITAVLGPLAKDRLVPLADRLARLAPCPACGMVTSNEVKIALGEAGDIWPNHIRSAVALAHYEDHVAQFH
ncbi:hypothetical protein [Bradyrhizobium sp. BWA-3-5]|uniref:hypothetical protein n=1 Tax=Bradyrhizobium sp. BWA-3-5 TaxID=3080013 RepID=UPI00293EE6EA|nr:hypothetical protein [Bradyrhizobium sp. BWA-3-5]WOH64058.1 hypothetical protein RX331_26035 [Bradyrhizobium sp. BWA-3-5]WOH64184.1 hypothetical protein RX331_26825 [Bradyrhizobium sp. BWA-3-5]WOH70108.1 hypothetical protein RX331_37970 [Bradyrhizobium sp. BWA-3-5]